VKTKNIRDEETKKGRKAEIKKVAGKKITNEKERKVSGFQRNVADGA
jgi:hypothetical protein